MNSKTIYAHVPYFYVIEHVKTGKKYAGCRWSQKATKFSANGCHPAELLNKNGYLTSSKIVNSIIEEEGLEAFRIDIILEQLP